MLSLGGVSMGIGGSIVDQAFFESYLGMRVESIDMSEFTRRIDEGIYDPVRIRARAGLGKRKLPGGQGLQPPAEPAQPGSKRSGLGSLGQNGADRPRHHGGQPDAWQKWDSAKKPWGATPSPAASRASASGRTISPTAISWKPSSTPRSIGTASARRTSLPPKMTALNGTSMLFGHLLTNTAQIFADVRTYWSPAAVKRVTGYELSRARRGRHPAPDQLRPGGAGRHRAAGDRAASQR